MCHHPLRARARACSIPGMTKNMRPMFASAAALSVLVLAACSGDSDPAPADAVPSPTASVEEVEEVEDAPVEEVEEVGTGSVLGDVNRGDYVAMGMDPGEAMSIGWAGDVATGDGSFVEYPDGLRVEFAGVEPGSAPVSEEEGDLDADKDLVRVSLLVSNSGPDALPVDGGFIPFRVFEGENLVEVDAHVGYFGEEDDLYSADDASVVAPGAELEVYRSFEVEPGAEIEVELNPDFFGVEHTPFVFYGITAP